LKKSNKSSNAFLSAMGMALSATLSVGFVNITPKVIYGEDNRHDVYQDPSAAVREAADSTVAFISNSQIKINGAMALITAGTLQKEMNVCPSEPYSQQPAAANCSGSLVGDDLIATAGHCVNANDCGRYSVVFGYRMQDQYTAITSIPTEDIYTCKAIVAREYTGNQDYALVRLDRPVKNHRVLTLSSTPVAPGDEIYVIGHPSGLPTKVTDKAHVRGLFSGYFRANLDTYGGNSGSAVFNSTTNQVIGILVRGETDFKTVGSCRVSNVCEEDSCRGEDVTNISYISQALSRAAL
jgi:hypothetical protein